MSQTLFTNATLACIDGDNGYGLRDDCSLLVEDDKIAWLGPMAERPTTSGAEIVDCAQRLLTPGLIDCHTHPAESCRPSMQPVRPAPMNYSNRLYHDCDS
jgi:imidazolonepropionase-like amidohydrolase